VKDLPPINSLLYLVVDEESNHRSRIEDVSGGVLTIAAPIGAGDVHVPDEDQQLTVFWAGIRTRYLLGVRLIGQTRQTPPRWHLQAAGKPTRNTRRNFVRGGGGYPVEIAPDSAGTRDLWLEGTTVDVSEGGMCCVVPLGLDTPADQLAPDGHLLARMSVAGQTVKIPANVITTRPAAEGGLQVVVGWEAPDSDAQAIRRHIFQWEVSERRRRLDSGLDV